MPDRHKEKNFNYLLIVSLLLHVVALAGLYYLSQFRQETPNNPVFLDLQDMPDIKAPAQQQETKRQSDQRIRVQRETAPRGNAPQDSRSSTAQLKPQKEQRPESATTPTLPTLSERKQQVAPGSSASSLLKPKPQATAETSQQHLFPGASRLSKLEESYRRKFESDIAEGDTRFLNSDDILFGSFLRRFEGAVYGVWRYPQDAAMRGIEGITPVRITFNKRGEITNIQQLESSGARILDDEVLRTLRAIGPVGGFPKGYNREEFHLIAFFQYGGTRRSLR